MKTIKVDITNLDVDVIVNAANGIGYMGGLIGRFVKLSGVAETIHYKTKGSVEKEAKQAAKKYKWLPRLLGGHRPGEIYTTHAGNLNASWIIHAVTMSYPGMSTDLVTIEKLLPLIINEARKLNANSIAFPILGAGTGGLPKDGLLQLYYEFLSHQRGLDIYICIL